MQSDVLNNLTYGLFVLTANSDGKDNGCIINTAIQIALNPLIIGMAVNKSNLTCEMIKESKKFTISILSKNAEFSIFEHFGYTSGREIDKFNGFSHCKRVSNGAMAVTLGTNGYICVDVTNQIDVGSHILFLGSVTDGEIFNSEPSADYAYYFENIKPKKENQSKSADSKNVWICKICGYEYEGDELPEDYICPICKHPASDFEKV